MRKKHIIAHSIIWAAIMIALSIILADTKQFPEISMLLIAGWYCSHFLLIRRSKNEKSVEGSCSKYSKC